jgi:hypothetical protein
MGGISIIQQVHIGSYRGVPWSIFNYNRPRILAASSSTKAQGEKRKPPPARFLIVPICTNFQRDPTSLKAASWMMPCTKVFHVKHFGTIAQMKLR